jgi:hypothetical protein
MLARRVVVLASCAACAPTPKQPISVAVLVEGRPTLVPSTSVHGLALHVADLAKDAAPATDAVTPALARARAAYAKGDHAACRSELAAIELPRLLATGKRDAAARALALDAACAYQGVGPDEAKRGAQRLATFGLDLPADAVAREVEDLIIAAIEAVGKAPRKPLAIAGQAGARVSLDGKPALCVVPCSVDVSAGEHVIAVEADGFEPAWKVVRDESSVTIAQPPASAPLAASQWRLRIGRGLPATDDVGASLLAIAAHEPRIAYVHAGRSLLGTMIVDGKPLARATDDRDASRLVRELAYDARILQRPKVWQRPWFWIAVAGGALAVSGAIVYVTYEPEVKTTVGF